MSDTDSMQIRDNESRDRDNDRFGEGAAYGGAEHGKLQPVSAGVWRYDPFDAESEPLNCKHDGGC